MIKYEDIKVPEGKVWQNSLSKLIGKSITDVYGYLSMEFGDVAFKLTEVVFEDGTMLGVEGEHDFPYVVEQYKQKQPNFDEETLYRLYEESNIEGDE